MTVCNGQSGAHQDATHLVEYLLERSGRIEKSNEAVAYDLAMFKGYGGGRYETDMGRYHRARNHIKDGTSPDGKPCVGYRLNYRSTQRGAELTLIDPTGDLGSHAVAAVETIRGWMTREAQHHTENRRQIETVERLGDHALARGDRAGYKLCARMSVEIEREGTVTPQTMADVEVWLAGVKERAA